MKKSIILFCLILFAATLSGAQKVRIVSADKAAEAFLKEKLTKMGQIANKVAIENVEDKIYEEIKKLVKI